MSNQNALELCIATNRTYDEFLCVYEFQDASHTRIARLETHRFMRLKDFKWVLVTDLYVHEDHRREGHAKRLLQRAIDDITSGGNGIYLLVIHDNTEAISLYQKMGFRKIRTYYFDDHPTPYYVMAYGPQDHQDQLSTVKFTM